jgi:hypothetical protein
MMDPLDLTITPIVGPIVEFDVEAITVPSMEAPLAPLWTTAAELESAKRLIAAVEVELRDEQEREPGFHVGHAEGLVAG